MANITKEHVEAVKKYKARYPEMTQSDMSKLVGVSQWAISCIVNGNYDHLLEDTKKEEKKDVISSDIPYEEYKKLVACELAIDEIFKRSIKSSKSENYGDDELFIDFRWLFGVLKRYFPERYEERLKELSEMECKNGNLY